MSGERGGEKGAVRGEREWGERGAVWWERGGRRGGQGGSVEASRGAVRGLQ